MAEILSATADLLKICGRPRMRPGKPRPRATAGLSNTPVQPRSLDASQFSLVGAIDRAAWQQVTFGGRAKATVSRAKKDAIELIAQACTGCKGLGDAELLTLIDNTIYDTRELVRVVVRAERMVTKR